MKILVDEFEDFIRPIMKEAVRNAAQPTAEQIRELTGNAERYVF